MDETSPEAPYPTPPFEKQDRDPPGLEHELDPRPRYQAENYSAAGKLKDRVALVTGGDSGIGRAVAYLFALEGADVAFTSLASEESDAEETACLIESVGRRAQHLVLDVCSPEACNRVVDEVVRSMGKLDVLVNNAAVQNHVPTIDELSTEQWDATLRTNVGGYFYMAKAALRYMGNGATIINTGSITGLEGSKSLLDYSASKGAIHALSKALAQQLVERGIRVNCVAPGPVWTPLNPAERDEEAMKKFGAGTPYGRPAQPEEIAPAYVYFASTDSSYVTGEILTLLGGATRAG